MTHPADVAMPGFYGVAHEPGVSCRTPQWNNVTLPMETLQQLKTRLREFVAERDWEQFHSPKNLSMALTVEAAELQEQFQWLTEAQSRSLPDERRVAVEQEIADIQIYLVRLADVLGVDIGKAVAAKMELNKQRYPVEKARGRAQKYTDFEDGG